jgi:uroporphyrinogen III methyltransferase/synthase
VRKLVLVTRPRAQAKALIALLEKRGLRVVCAPAIKILPPRSYARLDAALKRLAEFDAVVFTSANAVEHFFRRARGARPAQAFAVGPATAAALRARGVAAAPLPPEATGASLGRAMKLRRGARVLVPRAEKARPELPAILRKRGAVVSLAPAYRTVADKLSAAALKAAASADAVTFSSGSAVEHLRRQLGAARFKALFSRARAVSIGPTTTRALKAAGARNVAQAAEASDAGLARALR